MKRATTISRFSRSGPRSPRGASRIDALCCHSERRLTIEAQPLGLPSAMFTPVFAVVRTVGWVAHWSEMIADPEHRIFRPRQLYQGPTERPVTPIGQRQPHPPLVG